MHQTTGQPRRPSMHHSKSQHQMPTLKLITLLLSTAALVCSTAADPNIITKAQWNGEEAKNELQPLSLPVARVIIVHTAGTECSDADACGHQVLSLQRFHLSRGFDDIAYNFLIGNDGNVYEGRGWDMQGAAARNYNAGSLSVAFIGNYEKSLPSAPAVAAAQALLELGVRLQKLTDEYKLYGHRQLSSTSSPGAALYEQIKSWPHWSSRVIH